MDQCSLTIPKRALTLLVGSNGSGKSTLLRTLAGLYKTRPNYLSSDFVPRISSAFDFHGFDSRMTVKDNIHNFESYAGECLSISSRWSYCEETLGLAMYMGSKVRTLSLGTRQRLRLAMTLAVSADLYLFDEPFRALSSEFQKAFLIALDTLAIQQSSVVLSSHDLTLVSGMAHHAILLTGTEGASQVQQLTIGSTKTPLSIRIICVSPTTPDVGDFDISTLDSNKHTYLMEGYLTSPELLLALTKLTSNEASVLALTAVPSSEQ